ncbi:GerA spore germination protein [Solibacillus isronensis B3W22]|uniref:GerA spore germination protein n=1 Tax=Solibacillus isronensis B3W22 TaxID=1224748 RepID=K1KYB6_9BACL|nr:spore germination protein [Solibacillus isronensis]AMO85250.1 spore gernimation protein KA [Solibacillus silvestris]EKB44827.1 GerA spore germination protein [Solibacillus isronensis B3W22]
MWFKKKEKFREVSSSPATQIQEVVDIENDLIKTNLQQNLQFIKDALGTSSDIVIREILLGKEETIKAGIIYTDGLTDTTSLQNFILETLMLDIKEIELLGKTLPQKNLITVLKDVAMTVGDIKEIADFDVLFTDLLSGDTIILIDGYDQGLTISNRQWVERGVTEPVAQTVVRGPREGFTENLRVNTALIRRKIKDPNFWIESKKIGSRTKTNVAIAYINGIANDEIVNEVNLRLDRIIIDGILESGNIEELIQDTPYTPFPTVFNTERPDVVAAALLEGRIAIIVDGTPFVLIVPALFIQFFQSPEDYYVRTLIGSLVRLLRFLSFTITLLAPALFIAITTFHQTMLPPALLISLAAQREGVPFPAFVEALIMEITFEILREAGVRMPRAIGSAMSIVGAFVIGTAAVEAGIISAMMVIIVSITAISSFVSPSYDMAIATRILRFAFMALAASFGLYGITIGLIALILHLCSLRSFGIPYMSPVAPFNVSDQKDTFIVFPLWSLLTRPHLISQKNRVRQQNPSSAKPAPPKNKE